jgi:hypothetical protein
MAGKTPGRTIPEFPADDDLVLVADDGNVYWLKKADYTNEKFRVPQEARLTDQIDLLSKQGVLLADVRATSRPGVGAACFLVNLSAIRQQSPKLQSAPRRPPKPRKPPKPGAQEEPLQEGERDETAEGLHS